MNLTEYMTLRRNLWVQDTNTEEVLLHGRQLSLRCLKDIDKIQQLLLIKVLENKD